MTKVIFQISDSGAFVEPDNGVVIYPTAFDTSQNSRYGTVKIAGRKGGISQYMGANRKQYSINGLFLGDEKSMSAKRLALENLMWNTDSEERGKSVSMSIIYREGGYRQGVGFDVHDPGLETWSGIQELTHWSMTSASGTWSSTSAAHEGASAALHHTLAMLGNAEIRPHLGLGKTEGTRLPVEPNFDFSCSFWGLTTPTFSAAHIGSRILWMNSEFDYISTSYFDFITDSSWTEFVITGTTPSEAKYYSLHLRANASNDGVTIVQTVIDDYKADMALSTYVPGFTESQNINIRSYDIAQHAGTKNIFDVSVNMGEE